MVIGPLGPSVLGLLFSLSLAPGRAGLPAQEGQEAQADATPPQRFLGAIERWRAGDGSAAALLRRLGAELSRDYGRPDAIRVAEHYLGLSAESRALGLRREAEVGALLQRAERASRWSGEQLERWPRERAELLVALDRLAQEVRLEPDFVPAAEALSLSTRLRLAQAERDSSLDSIQKQALLQRVEADALESKALFERAGQLTPQLEPGWILADLARVQQRHSLARQRFLDLGLLAQRVSRPSYQEQSCLGLLRLAKESGDPAAAERQLAALARLTTPQESWPLAREHALSLYHADRAEEALSFLTEHAPKVQLQRKEWHALMAASLMRTGDRAGAAQQLDTLATHENAHEDAEWSLARATLELAEGRPKAARTLLASLRTTDLSTAAAAQAAALEGEAWLAEAQPFKARAALGRALQLADDWSARLGEGLGSIDGEWLGLHAVVLAARAHAECGDGLEAARVLEAHQSRGLRAGATGLSSERLLSLAASTEAGLLSVGVGADESLVVHLDPDGVARWASIPVGRRRLGTAVRRLREACLAEDEARVARLADELSRTLLPANIASALSARGPNDRLLVLAHGPIESLPLGLLPLAGQCLDERLALVVLPGVPRASSTRPFDPSAQPWLFLGAPRDDSLAPLPAARQELHSLASRRPGAGLAVDEACTAQALLGALAQGRAIHVATHLVRDGTCDDQRLAGEALALAGGQRLCAAEIAARPAGPPVPLAVLLACSSGGGRFLDGEGLIGVARALLETGTERLCVTLWPVRDRSARLFAERFHRGLDQGLDPARAAQVARDDLRRNGSVSRDWAAFRILGRP